jgi:hypothetical protein
VAIYDQNGVPLLDLPDESQAAVDAAHQAAMEAAESDTLMDHANEEGTGSLHYLVGEHVWLHNPKPRSPLPGAENQDSYTHFRIGGSTLDEAIKEVISAFDQHHVADNDTVNPPQWVASTSPELGKYISEHYTGGRTPGNTCALIEQSEVQ